MIHKIIDGTTVPANLRQDFPSTSFPADLSVAVLPDGYVWVAPTAPPECGQFEHVVPADPAQIDGKWVQGWQVVPWTPEEIQAHLVATIQQHLDATAQARAYDGILTSGNALLGSGQCVTVCRDGALPGKAVANVRVGRRWGIRLAPPGKVLFR